MGELVESYTYGDTVVEVYNELNIHKLTESIYEFAIKYDLYEEEKGD